jgi:hypothetical protein
MAFFTINHLHGRFAVSGYQILSIRRKGFLVGDVPVTACALQPLSLVRSMGEVDVVGLPGIDLPWHFAVFLHIVANKGCLRLTGSLGGFMALLAPVEPGDAPIGAVREQAVAGFTVLALVRDMAEIEGLSLLRIKQVRKDDPADDQSADKAYQKKNYP